MLTAAQVQVIAFHSDNGPLCNPCARAEFGELHIDRAMEGLNDRGIIEYTLSSEYADHEHEMWRESMEQEHGASEWAVQDEGEYGYKFEDGTFVSEQEAWDASPVLCADCSTDLIS